MATGLTRSLAQHAVDDKPLPIVGLLMHDGIQSQLVGQVTAPGTSLRIGMLPTCIEHDSTEQFRQIQCLTLPILRTR